MLQARLPGGSLPRLEIRSAHLEHEADERFAEALATEIGAFAAFNQCADVDAGALARRAPWQEVLARL